MAIDLTDLPGEDVPIADGGGFITLAWRVALEQGASISGWGVPTGTFSRLGFASYSAPTIAGSYAAAQLQIQALANAVQNLSEVVAALVTDVRSS